MLYERTLGQWLEHWATTTPDKEYIVYSDRNLRFTWSQFNRRVDDMAKGLIAIGVERGTHVGIWAANVPDWLTLLYACAKIGAVYVTVNTNYKQAELEYLCENSDMHTLCIVNGEKDSDFVQMTYTMLPELKTCQRGHLKSERFPYMKNVIYVGQEKHRGMYNTSEILLLGDNVEDTRLNELKSRVSCHDVVNMQYTSGTTGFPKGVMLTHYNITNNGFLTGEHMKFTAADKLCCCVPPVPLLRRGACHDELPYPRLYTSHGGTLQPVGGACIHPQRTMHRTLRRTHDVHSRAAPSDVRPVRYVQPAHGYHGRLSLPRRADEAGRGKDVHESNQRLRPNGSRSRHDRHANRRLVRCTLQHRRTRL